MCILFGDACSGANAHQTLSTVRTSGVGQSCQLVTGPESVWTAGFTVRFLWATT